MAKHAYLIITHKIDFTLKTLLSLLDDERNDIFLHVDKKTVGFKESDVQGIVTKGSLHVLKRRQDVRWGHHSCAFVELELLEEATKHGHYDFYHLLSGEDLPIKSQDYIHGFFDANKGKEFVRFQSETFPFPERMAYYYPFQKYIGKGHKDGFLGKLTRWEDKILRWQERHNVRRNKDVKFQKGTQWFSITDELARDLIAFKSKAKRIFWLTFCADESLVQTYIVNNPKYIERLYHKEFDNDMAAIQRLIDWKRGFPYVWRETDFQEIMDSELLFARKFDCKVDAEIIKKIAAALS